MKMKFSFLIYSLSFLLLISFVPSVYANNYVSEKISVTDAEQAAQKFIGYINKDSWHDAQLKFSNNLYDIDETLLAYYFLINDKSGMNKGHIIVSATKDRGPVLEFGDGVIQFDQSGLKSYFINGIVQASNAEEILRIAKEKNLNLKSKEKTATNSKLKWDQLLSNDSAPLSIMSTVSKELGVSRYHQRMTGVTNQSSACGPTTGAMISDYLWHYYNVPGSFDYDGVPKLINHLYSEMGTSSFGTSLGDFSVGLLTHLREYGEKWVGVQYRGTDEVAWNNFQGDIDDYNFPTGIRFDFWVSGSTYTNYHFVAGIGYKIVDGTKYFGFKDPDGGSNNTGTIYRLWSDNDQDIGLLHLWKQ